MALNITGIFDKYQDTIYLGLFKILNSCTGSLNNPCYNPPVSAYVKKTFEPLFKEISKDDNFDVVKEIKNRYINKVYNARLLGDNSIWFLTLISVYFYGKSKQDTLSKDIMFASAYLIYLKYYTSLSNKHMPKVCNKDKAELALSLLSEKSLFSSKNTKVLQHSKTIVNEYSLNGRIKNGIVSSSIALGLIYLFDVIKDTYYERIKNIDDAKNISKLIMAMRDRLSQSFKAYANQYYKVINNNIQTDIEEESNVLNDVNRVMSVTSQGMIYIPDEHYKKVFSMTEIPLKYLTVMFTSAFKDINNTDRNTPDIVNIILTDKKKEFENSDIDEWLKHVSNTVAIRSRYAIRDLILNIIRSNEELNNVFESKSISFKHKMIQAQGLVIGLAIYDTLKQYMLGSIKTFYIY